MDPTTNHAANSKALGDFIYHKRKFDLRLSQQQVLERGGPSKQTQTAYERGIPRKNDPEALARFEHALDLEAGTLSKILETGKAPIPQPVRSTGKSSQATESTGVDLDRLQEGANNVIKHLMGAYQTDGVPASAARGINQALIDALQLLQDMGGTPSHAPPPTRNDHPSNPKRTPGHSAPGVPSRHGN